MRAMNVARMKHGHSRRGQETPEFRIWRNMIERCENSKHKSYKRYGGRGISVCERWRDSFDAFFADVGPRAPSLSLERKKNDVGYEPGNVEWATWRVQARNREGNRRIVFRGKSRTVVEVSEMVGIAPPILYERLNHGWSISRATKTPSMLSAHKPSVNPGDVVGRLTVVERVPNDRHGKSRWQCRCACGATTEVAGTMLVQERTRSCGCLRRDLNRQRASA